ncbi:thioredoxin family protein [Halorussus amylolyticus]|uniref:thioredoxin family protein n=1 Tax=Halorussus amylolyticus TaxID=1126242 RepID=UPI001045BCE3|nr:thioredoxin family protein [Halorussus amylolyticus]
MDEATALLFSNDVLNERDGEISLSSEFESSLADHQATVAEGSGDELGALIREKISDETVVEPFVRLAEKDPRTVAELCALADFVDAAADEWLPVVPLLRLFRPDPVRTDGVPDRFVPVPGDHLPEFVDIYARLFVYVWLDDCEPCDALKARLESVFEEPRDVLPVAVYGPEYKETLRREYDVTAGPAMLFVRDGAVDTRLYGDNDEGVIETELEALWR